MAAGLINNMLNLFGLMNDFYDDSGSSEGDYYDDDGYYMQERHKENIIESYQAAPEPDMMERKLLSLVDLAAEAVAKTTPCSVLESFPLDENLLKKISCLAFPKSESLIEEEIKIAYDLAPRECKNKTMSGNASLDNSRYNLQKDEQSVTDMCQVGFMATANVDNHRVYLTFEKQTITSQKCSNPDCAKTMWCEHVITAVLYRLRNPEEVPVHAPVTEILSTLSRDQLQKLLQYAINDDPAGVLDKVFKYIGKIRDKQSDINTIDGAPDPTFGVYGDESQWEKLLRHIRISLTELIEKISRQIDRSLDRGYNTSLLESDRHSTSWPLYVYFDKAICLCKKGSIDKSIDILHTIADTLISVFPERPYYGSTFVQKFITDLADFFTLLIVNPQVNSSQRQRLHDHLIIYQKQRRWKMSTHVRTMFSSNLPTICDCLQVMDERSIEYHEWINSKPKRIRELYIGSVFTPCLYMLEKVGPMPQSLQEVINGNAHPLVSSYEEPLAIMMLRFKSLYYYGHQKQDSYRLALLIINRLDVMTRVHSILYVDQSESRGDDETIETDVLKTSYQARTKKLSTVKTPGKRSRVIEDSDDCSVPKKKNKMTIYKSYNKDLQEMVTMEMAYFCLGFLLQKLDKIDAIMHKADSEAHSKHCTLLLRCKMRFIEMGRFRLVSQSLSQDEQKHLHKLENQVVSRTFCSTTKITLHTCMLQYSEKWKLPKNLEFYEIKQQDGITVLAFPLLLLHKILNLYTVETRNGDLPEMFDNLSEVCVYLLCKSSSPMSDYTLPTESTGSGYYRSSTAEDSMVNAVPTMFFEFSDFLLRNSKPLEKENHQNAVLQVIEHVKKMKQTDFVLLSSILRSIDFYKDNLCDSKATQELCLSAVIHGIKLALIGNDRPPIPSTLQSLFLWLLKKIGQQALDDIELDLITDVFGTRQIEQLLLTYMGDCTMSRSPYMYFPHSKVEPCKWSENVKQLVQIYMLSKTINEESVLKIVKYLDPSSDLYSKVLAVMTENKYHAFSLIMLLNVAQHDYKWAVQRLMKEPVSLGQSDNQPPGQVMKTARKLGGGKKPKKSKQSKKSEITTAVTAAEIDLKPEQPVKLDDIPDVVHCLVLTALKQSHTSFTYHSLTNAGALFSSTLSPQFMQPLAWLCETYFSDKKVLNTPKSLEVIKCLCEVDTSSSLCMYETIFKMLPSALHNSAPIKELFNKMHSMFVEQIYSWVGEGRRSKEHYNRIITSIREFGKFMKKHYIEKEGVKLLNDLVSTIKIKYKSKKKFLQHLNEAFDVSTG